jgi:ribokinase
VLLLQLELPVETALAAARIAAAAGTTVVLNPAPWTTVPDELLALTDVLVPNEPEAAQLLGLEVTQLDADDAVRRIVERYDIGGVIITLGERGAVVAADDLTTHLAPHDLDAIDTVGAGDAYCGALAARLADGATLLEAARYANAAAAIAVTRVGGAQSAPRRAEVEALVTTPLADTAPA